MIDKSVLSFLKALKKNNNRTWFNEHKPTYEAARATFKTFAEQLQVALSEVDGIEGYKLFRIYRDVRFSKDKTPYKTAFSGYTSRAGLDKRGGFYVHIEPGNCFVGGGFWKPEKDDLFRIRKEIEADPGDFRKVFSAKSFQEYYGGLQGEQLKTAPKGFAKDHEAIDLLRYKQFIASRKLTEKEVQSEDFISDLVTYYKAMLPFFDLFSEVLSTNLNGEKIV